MKDRSPHRAEHHRGVLPAAILGLATITAACRGNSSPTPPPTTESITTTTPLPSTTTELPQPTTTVTELPTKGKSKILSLSSMNQSKDRVCNQRPPEWIAEWVLLAKGLGVSHIGLETPYDGECKGNTHAAESYTKEWVDAIHGAGLSVWHRHMFANFEGIYGGKRIPGLEWGKMVGDYITAHPDYFQDGDLITPMAEPFNGGVNGVTGCPGNQCMFNSRDEYEEMVLSTHNAAVDALQVIGKKRVVVTGPNENGFTFFGAENPDHAGKRGDSLVTDRILAQGGLVVVDHNPPADSGRTMAQDLEVLHVTFPGLDYMVGETSPNDRPDWQSFVEDTLRAYITDPHCKAIQYWQGGPTSAQNEGLFDEKGGHPVPNARYAQVKTLFAAVS